MYKLHPRFGRGQKLELAHDAAGFLSWGVESDCALSVYLARARKLSLYRAGGNMKAIDVTVSFTLVTALAPAAAFAPSTMTGAGVRRNRGKTED